MLMEYAGEVVLELPDHKICVNPWKIKKKDAEVLSKKITEARINITAYGKVPPKKDEPREEWLERYAEYLAEQRKPKKDELAAAYVERMLEPTGFKDNMEFLKAVLIACTELIGQGNRITDEVMEELSLLEADNFCKSILKVAKCPCPELD